MRRLYAWIPQFIGTLLFVCVPLLWPEQFLKAREYPFFWYVDKQSQPHANFPAIFVALGIAITIAAQIFDKTIMSKELSADLAKEIKGIVSDRRFMEAYSVTVSSIMQVTKTVNGMTPAQMAETQKDILQGICLVIQHYYDKARELGVNACWMLAHPINSLPNGIEQRLKFHDKARDIRTYASILDLQVWAEDEPDLPSKLALPVEDPSDDDYRFRMLPGAPASLAYNRVTVLPDTHDVDGYLKEYFETDGKNVNPTVRAAQVQFFREHGFRSFACFPLAGANGTRGVLNVHTRKPYIFGPHNENEQLVTDLLEPIRTGLNIFI